MLSIILLAIAGIAPWDIVQVVAFGLIVWLFNKLGLSAKATLIGNIVAGLVLLFFVFIVR